MNTNEFYEAIKEAERVNNWADRNAQKFAELLKGRMRNVTRNNMWCEHNLLVALKRELSQYDAKARKWKS